LSVVGVKRSHKRGIAAAADNGVAPAALRGCGQDLWAGFLIRRPAGDVEHGEHEFAVAEETDVGHSRDAQSAGFFQPA